MDSNWNIQDIWPRVSNYLKSQMDAIDFERGIANIIPVSRENRTVLLGIPSGELWIGWLEDNYRKQIEDALLAVTGESLKIRFETGYDVPQPETTVASEKRKESAGAAHAAEKSAGASVSEEAPAFAKRLRDPHLMEKSSIQMLDRRFTFDTFVVGENNKFAYNACRAVAQNPGGRMNPLFIHSGTGLGKTHLMQAIAQDVIARNPRAKVLYVSSEDFLNQYIETMFKKNFSEFRNRFRNLDVLLLDDVQFIGNKEGFQMEVFNTFNALFNARKQIVMASDRPPQEIDGLEQRLVSRFEWGLTTEILPPDFETRVAIIHKKQEEQDFKLSEDVVRYVAARLKSNVRRLEAGIFKLVSWASMDSDIVIDIPATEKLLRDVFADEADALLTVDEIQRIVAEFYDIRLQDMTSHRRPANIALPRQVAMYFARKLTELSLPAIAEKFCRNHATVIHAVSAIESKLQEDTDFNREIGQLEHRLKV